MKNRRTLIMTLLHIRYKDHILFRNADPNLFHPVVRECIGWFFKENEKAIWVISDRSTEPIPYEKIQPSESGFVILKSNIIEVKKLS